MLGFANEKLGRDDRPLEYYFDALEQRESVDCGSTCRTLASIAKIHKRREQWQPALDFYGLRFASNPADKKPTGGDDKADDEKPGYLGATVDFAGAGASVAMTGGTTTLDRTGGQTLILAGANDSFSRFIRCMRWHALQTPYKR